MKKFLTFVLVLAMVMSVSSFAMAAEYTVKTAVEFKEKIESAPTDGSETKIILGDNIGLNGGSGIKAGVIVPEGANIILDLQSYTLSYETSNADTTALIRNNGKLTIMGSGTITNTATSPDSNWDPEGFPTYANNTITNYGTLIVNGGTIENKTSGKGFYCAIDNSSNGVNAYLTVNAGNIRCDNNTAIRQHANSATHENTVVINGGNIEGTRGIWIHLTGSDNNKTKKASLSITNGVITATDPDDNAVYAYSYGDSRKDTTVNISGGTFNGCVGFSGGSSNNSIDNENVSITGGTFDSVERYVNTASSTGFISGGTFSEDPSAYLASNYVVNKDANGNYVPAEATNVNAPAVGEDASVTTYNSDEIVKIAKDQVNALTDGKSLVVKTANGMEFTFSKDLLKGLLGDDGSYVAIKIKEIAQTELNEAQQKAIESTAAKLVFTAEIYVNGEYVGDKLDGKTVAVLIPVSAAGLSSSGLEGYSLVYISDDGKLEIIANAEAGATEIKAELPHFSEYAVIKTEDANKIIASQKTPATSSTGSGYSGPDVWYIGGNTFGTNTNQVPTSVEIDQVPVSFTMNGSQITVDCITPGAKWVKVSWGSTTNTRYFTPDANAYCAQAVIPKTGDMSIWAAIAQFLGF